MLRVLKWLLIVWVLLALLVSGWAWVWLHEPLPMGSADAGGVDVNIPAGASARSVARTLVQAGVQAPEDLLYVWFRLSGQSRQIRAGSYELAPGSTPLIVLDKLVRGEQAVRRVALLEGWNFRQVLQALRQAEHLEYDLPPDSSRLMALLGRAGVHPEGRFFPDTYVYPKHGKASAVLKQAAQAMDQRLAEVWASRTENLPLRSPDEALILASIVEKETGQAQDRAQIAGVFINRLRIGMRLQTDPTVIYGLGERFDGNLRRRDLETDTPYNTYTRAGLPPTPIAMPGMDALKVSVKPAATKALYFVAKGDGTSHFSTNLNEHNAAVQRYILNR